jgi:AcrR family transcriptional regulator
MDTEQTPVAGIRARNRAAIEAEIMRVAAEHLATYGAAGLSLRAIARDLGMASSAVYRYVESRDELLTRLIVAAFDSLGDTTEAALTARRRASPLEQFRAIGHAVRGWARARPHEYALIYGSPVPGYHAPPERTVDPGTRVPRLLIGVLTALERHAAGSALEERAFGHLLADPVFAGTDLTSATLHRGLAAWTLVLGAITTELFEQLGADAFPEPDAFFEAILDDAELLVDR